MDAWHRQAPRFRKVDSQSGLEGAPQIRSWLHYTGFDDLKSQTFIAGDAGPAHDHAGYDDRFHHRRAA